MAKNGRGKSTILQAIALTLSTADELKSLKLDARNYLRDGTSEGLISVRMVGRSNEYTLRLSHNSAEFSGYRPSEPIAILGYGETRLPPRGRSRVLVPGSRIANLFDPFVSLVDAEQWMLTLSKEQFSYAARAFKDLLSVAQRDVLFKIETENNLRHLAVHFGRSRLSLEKLSDGYQSIVALAADIIRGLYREFKGGVESAEGILLIDEIGAHLHPRWKMKIVNSLRETFPRLQFIATSHDPLCLRGLKNGEVIVLHRSDSGRIFQVLELPPIEGLRVDQLLTSEYFGLSSTLDPSIEADFEEFYRLKAKRHLSNSESQRMRELDEKLTPIEIPGTSRRERMLLEAIDRYLSKVDETPTTAGRSKLRKEADAAIARALK